MEFNATFNNISDISWWSVLLVDHCPQKYGKKNDHLLLLHKSAQKVGHKLNPSST
jgi:hypothetical protein